MVEEVIQDSRNPLCVIWKIWCSRNMFMFDGGQDQPMQVVKVLCSDIHQAYSDAHQKLVIPRMV